MSAPTDPVLNIFYQTGAYLRGHFRLSSGLHSREYLQCALVLQYPERAARLGAMLASALRALVPGLSAKTVVSPAIGGLIIGHEVARALGGRAIFTERDPEGKMILRRGFSVEPGEQAVVIEDVVTTGGSTREVVACLAGAGADVVAAGSIIDRSAGKAEVGAPRVSLASLNVVAYPPEGCPLCQQGVPVTKPGSRPTPAAG